LLHGAQYHSRAALQSTPSSPEQHRARWKWLVGAVVLAALVAGWFALPVQQWADALQGWIEQRGAWGWLIFSTASPT